MRAKRTPVTVAHVLHDVLRHFSPAFFRHQYLIRFLLGTQIRDTEVQCIPGKGQIRQGPVTFLRRRWPQGLDTVLDADRAAAGIIAARHVASPGNQTRQHFKAGHVMQTARQRVFHQLQAVIEVVLQGPSRRFIKRHRLADRLLCAVHDRAVIADPFLDFILGIRHRLERTATGDQEGNDTQEKTLAHRTSTG